MAWHGMARREAHCIDRGGACLSPVLHKNSPEISEGAAGPGPSVPSLFGSVFVSRFSHKAKPGNTERVSCLASIFTLGFPDSDGACST
jgi:hypothetical protein